MSMDKAIKHGKEHRKSYKSAKSVDPRCRNHGDCPYCHGNRLYTMKKTMDKMKNRIENAD